MDKKQESMIRLNENLKRLLQRNNVMSSDDCENLNGIFEEKNYEDISMEDFLDEVNEQILVIMESLDDAVGDDYCNEELKERIAGLEEENGILLEQLESLLNGAAVQETPGDVLGIIKDIIEMRETMYARIDWSEDNPAEENIIKILNAHLKETAKILQNAGVTIHDDADEVDVGMCTIVDTVETDDDELVNKVVKVFRPGYEYNGEMLKSKEVIIYVKRVE